MKSDFKILHISSPSIGGAARAAFRIHQALQKNGVDSQFFAINDNLKELDTPVRKKDFLTQKIQWRLRHHFGIELDTRRRIEKELAALSPLNCEIASIPVSAYLLDKFLQTQKPDIVHLHWVAQNFDYPDFFKYCPFPIVWTLHDMNPFSGLFHYKNDSIKNLAVANKLDTYVTKMKRRAVQHFNKKLSVVTPSAWLAKEAGESLVFRNRSVTIIPYAIDLNTFSPMNKTDSRKRHGFSENQKILIALADYTQIYRKGFDLLKETISKMPDVLLLLIGGKPDDAKDKINIQYLGRINDDKVLAEYYSLADATVIPSREDNLPNVMLESFACGTPVISFKVGGLAEHVNNFDTGLIAEEINAASLHKTIQTFFDNKEKFDSKKIRKYAEDHFNEKLIAGKYMEVYADSLAKP